MACNEFESSHRIKIDDHKGSLAIGKDADIVVVDDTIRVDKQSNQGLYINIKELMMYDYKCYVASIRA